MFTAEMKKAILEFVGSEKELELEAFRMASGGEANWRAARDEGCSMGSSKVSPSS